MTWLVDLGMFLPSPPATKVAPRAQMPVASARSLHRGLSSETWGSYTALTVINRGLELYSACAGAIVAF